MQYHLLQLDKTILILWLTDRTDRTDSFATCYAQSACSVFPDFVNASPNQMTQRIVFQHAPFNGTKKCTYLYTNICVLAVSLLINECMRFYCHLTLFIRNKLIYKGFKSVR